MPLLELASSAAASPLIRVDASVFEWEERLCALERDLAPSESQCLKLLDVTVGRARREQSLQWAAMAMRASALLGGRYRNIAELDVMRLRVEFIAKQGSLPDDPVLDVDLVVRWFLESLPCSAADAPSYAVDADLRSLRQLKSRIGLMQQLADCGELPSQPELRQWLDLDALLP